MVHVLFDAYPLHLATVSHAIVLLIFFSGESTT